MNSLTQFQQPAMSTQEGRGVTPLKHNIISEELIDWKVVANAIAISDWQPWNASVV